MQHHRPVKELWLLSVKQTSRWSLGVRSAHATRRARSPADCGDRYLFGLLCSAQLNSASPLEPPGWEQNRLSERAYKLHVPLTAQGIACLWSSGTSTPFTCLCSEPSLRCNAAVTQSRVCFRWGLPSHQKVLGIISRNKSIKSSTAFQFLLLKHLSSIFIQYSGKIHFPFSWTSHREKWDALKIR